MNGVMYVLTIIFTLIIGFATGGYAAQGSIVDHCVRLNAFTADNKVYDCKERK